MPLQAPGVEAEGCRIDIGEMRHGAAVGDGVGRGDEGQGRDNYVVARLDADDKQGGVQGRRAVDRGYGVARAGNVA